MRKKNKIFNALVIVQIVVLIGLVISYGWFADTTNPTISENNIKVSSADGLVIKLNPDSEARTLISLDELLSDWDDFELEQMSSADGNNFYTIDFGAGLSNNNPKYIPISKEASTGTINMEKYGCIDYNFYFSTEDFAKHIYFHKDSYINGVAESAIRIAITTTQYDTTTTKIFGTTKEDGTLANPFTTNAVASSGEFDYSETSNEYTTTQVVHTFDEFNGDRGTSDNTTIDLSKVLFTMNANSTIKVNVKIWLEGGDLDCDNELADSSVDVLLKFGSANVLRDAPNVYANNTTLRITNLATTMEYAYTNNESTTWTKVSNKDMTFTRGKTVYVRYSEVTGVSSSSYVTPVTFNG